MPTLYVVDPKLVNQGGHYLSQHTALWNLCQTMGFSMVSYVDINFDEHLMPGGVTVEKVFDTNLASDIPGHFCVQLGASNIKCNDDLRKIDHKKFGSDDILFITSATAEYSVAYGQWLRDISSELKCKVGLYTIISSELDDTLGRDIRRNGIVISDDSFAALDQVVVPNEVKRSIYRYLIDSIPSDKAYRYKIFYEEPFVSRLFLDLCDKPEIEFVYLHSMYPGEFPVIHSDRVAHAPKRLAYLGSGGVGGDSKGQHLIVDVVDYICEKHASLSWTIQLGHAGTSSGVSDQQQTIIETVRSKSNVDLRVGMLSCGEYSSLVEGADLMLLPYGSRYRHIMSGIFDDCLFQGKVCVIPKQSKMALWMERHNLDYPGFTQWSSAGVIKGVEDALGNFDYYQEHFFEAQKICHQRWNMKNPIAVFHNEVQ